MPGDHGGGTADLELRDRSDPADTGLGSRRRPGRTVADRLVLLAVSVALLWVVSPLTVVSAVAVIVNRGRRYVALAVAALRA